MGKYQDLAAEIVTQVGGKENIASLSHCITRLRFKLKDEARANDAAFGNMDGVVNLVKSGGQYQVVIGTHVADVYADVIALTGESSSEDHTDNQSRGVLDRFIDTISGIFQPVLGVMAAAGIIKGFNVLFQTIGWYSDTSGTYTVLNAVGDALFMFLPVFLGFTAANKFHVRPMVGLLLGAVLCYPTIQLSALSGGDASPLQTLFDGSAFASPVYIDFLGIPVISMDYVSTVIPVIFVVYFASKIEKFFDRVISDLVKFFLVPMLTVVISAVVGLLLIGPVTSFGSSLIADGVMAVRDFSPFLAGLIVGGTWQILVIFGLHWGFIPVYVNNIMTLGYDNVMMPFFAASFVTTGVVAGIYFRTKDRQLKALTVPSFISGIFGVTEPAIYGILLPLRRPFVISCVVSSVIGGFLAMANLREFMFGGIGVFELPAMIDPSGDLSNLYVGIVGMIVALIAGFVATLLLFKDKPQNDGDTDTAVTESEAQTNEVLSGNLEIQSPLTGRLIPLEEGQDQAFASGALGKGVIVEPSEGLLVAPFDGTVTAFFPTLHAIGLTSVDGCELLIHVGLNTVEMKGEGFTAFVKKGDAVKAGQKLLSFDIEAIRAAGYATETPITVPSSKKYMDVIVAPTGSVSSGDPLLHVIKESPSAVSREAAKEAK